MEESMNTRRIFQAITVVFLSVATVLAAPPPGAPTVNDPEAWVGLDAQAIERVKKGEIVVLGDGGSTEGAGTQAMIKAAFIVDVNIAEAYRILRETEKQYEYTAGSDKNVLITRTETYDIVEFVTKYLTVELHYRVKHQWDNKKFKMWWALDPTFKNDFKKLEGSYNLFYLDDNHTLIRYGTILVVSEFAPKAIQTVLVKRDLPNGLEDVRKRINSHGTYKKKGK